MVKNKYYKTFVILCVYFISFVIALACHSNFWGNILFPTGALLSFTIILSTYLKSSRTIEKTWLLLGLACLVWAIGDVLWIVNLFLHQNPGKSDLVSCVYAVANILIFSVIIIKLVDSFKKWNTIKLVVDCIAISISSLYFLWIVFFDNNLKVLNIININEWVDLIGVVFDVVAFVSIAIWYFSIRCKKIPAYIGIEAGSILLYYITDLSWFYLYFRNLYVSNSMIDAFYLLSLLGFAVALEVKMITNQTPDSPEYNCSNLGMKHRNLIILLAPVLTMILKGFVLGELIIFLIIILIHEILTFYIQSSVTEHALNVELEERIAKRTQELVEKNKQLEYLSSHDTVTNLYNRRFFIQQLEKIIANAASDKTLALLYIDIDRFKTINDTYGHNVGDQVLIELSNRMLKKKQQDTIIARLGGDEFVFAIHADYSYQEAEKIAQQIIADCSKPFKIGNYSPHITISIGISIYPLDAHNSSTMLKNADMAMYDAKDMGCGRFMSFNQQINSKQQRKNEIEILLKHADFDKEFTVFYQPQFNIPGKKLIGMEALLRWNSPEKGFIPPDEFIPIAEETKCIVSIGDWVMRKAITQIACWNHTYGLELTMAINVSPQQLNQNVFIDKLRSCVKNNSVKPCWVDIEITESVAIREKYRMSEIAERIKNAGFSISIDDFGTGYSSLSYLKLFPIDRIKIAKQLIDAITTDNYDLQITKFIILLAKSIGISTIAEGVELQQQFNLLADLGCEQIQGYFLGKPMPPLKFEETLLKKNTFAVI